MDSVDELLRVSVGPMGPPVEVEFDSPGAWPDLGRMLSRSNGFFAFNAGIQVFRVTEEGLGPDLSTWNSEEAWKHTYGHLADGLFFFAQDLLGVQYGLDDAGRVVFFDPETADRRDLGGSLAEWASYLLDQPDDAGEDDLAWRWQKANGALGPDERLIPRRFFVLGGSRGLDNLMCADAAKAMRIRGPIAQQIHGLPDGSTITIRVT